MSTEARSDIDASLEGREFLHLELDALSKEAAGLDADVDQMRRQKEELERLIETQKRELISGSRRLKSLNLERTLAEYSTQDCNDEIQKLAESFESRARIYGSLEVEVLKLEREIEWKCEDIQECTAVRDEHRRKREERLKPFLEEKKALEEESARVAAEIEKLESEKEEAPRDSDSDERHELAEVKKLKMEIANLERRNEDYRTRMKQVLDDLSVKVVICQQKRNRKPGQQRVRDSPLPDRRSSFKP